MNGILGASGVELVDGVGELRTWRPASGLPKSFCGVCGGHVFSGDLDSDGVVGVRFGALDADPGMAPRWRQWLSSAPDWAPIPDDGLPRFPETRELD